MTPRDIITQRIERIPNIRIPLVRLIVNQIFDELEEHGYHITERGIGDEARTGHGGSGTGKSGG